MFLPPLSVFTQRIQCVPGFPHANFVEQFVTFAERHLDKSRLDTEIISGSRTSSGYPTYAFSHHCQYLFHAVYLLEITQ